LAAGSREEAVQCSAIMRNIKNTSMVYSQERLVCPGLEKCWAAAFLCRAISPGKRRYRGELQEDDRGGQGNTPMETVREGILEEQFLVARGSET